MNPTCQRCGNPIPRRTVSIHLSPNAWAQRQYCSVACRRSPHPTRKRNSWNNHNEAFRQHTEGRIEEVEFLLSFGLCAGDIAAKFGILPGSLARWLDRHGRRDLATLFWSRQKRDDTQQRRAA